MSLLVDGELADDEAAQVTGHVAGCAACQEAQRMFAGLRQALRDVPTPADPFAERRALHGIQAAPRPPLWRRQVALPLPIVALLVMLLAAAGALTVAGRGGRAPAAQTVGDTDFARFDRGERPAVYVVKRAGARP